MKRISLLLLSLLLFSITLPAQIKPVVIVYGSTPSGVIAAIAASRQGAAVTLVEQTKHVGGMNTSGIGTAETEHLIEETIVR